MKPKKPSLFSPLVLCLLPLLISPLGSQAQSLGAPHPFWSRVSFGGGIGLGFTNGGFSGSIAPSALYRVNDYFGLGAGLSLSYSKFETQRFVAYGGSILGLFDPVRFLQLSAEFEPLRVNHEYSLQGGDYSRDYWATGLYLGAGFRTNNVTFGVRYDVLHDQDSFYADAWSPFVRVYF